MRTTIDPKLNIASIQQRQVKKTSPDTSPSASFDDALKAVKPKAKAEKHEDTEVVANKKPQTEPKKKTKPSDDPDHAEASDSSETAGEIEQGDEKKPVDPESSTDESSDEADESQDKPAAVKEKKEEVDTAPTDAAEISALAQQQTQSEPHPVDADAPETDETAEVEATDVTVAKTGQPKAIQKAQQQQGEATQADVEAVDQSTATETAAVTPLQSADVAKQTDEKPTEKTESKKNEAAAAEEKLAAAVPDAKPQADVEKTSAVTEQLQAQAPQHSAQPAHLAAKAPETNASQQPQVSQDVRFADDNHPSIVSGIRGELLPDGGKMTLKLDPPELGALQVQVHMQDGAMTATFQTTNDDATRMLSHSLASLKNSLEAQGISVEKLQVQQAPKDQQANTNQDQREGQQQQQWDNPSAKQEQQRREMLQRMWRKLAGTEDPLDMVA